MTASATCEWYDSQKPRRTAVERELGPTHLSPQTHDDSEDARDFSPVVNGVMRARIVRANGA